MVCNRERTRQRGTCMAVLTGGHGAPSVYETLRMFVIIKGINIHC